MYFATVDEDEDDAAHVRVRASRRPIAAKPSASHRTRRRRSDGRANFDPGRSLPDAVPPRAARGSCRERTRAALALTDAHARDIVRSRSA
jgi:hypothetical protein